MIEVVPRPGRALQSMVGRLSLVALFVSEPAFAQDSAGHVSPGQKSHESGASHESAASLQQNSSEGQAQSSPGPTEKDAATVGTVAPEHSQDPETQHAPSADQEAPADQEAGSQSELGSHGEVLHHGAASEKASEAPPKPTPGAAESDEEAEKEANNPLSNLTSVSFQDYKTLAVSQETDANRDQGVSNVTYVRLAKSIGSRVLVRASLPLVSTQNEGKSGLGDMNIIVPILLNKMDSPLKFGVGPLMNLRTHTEDGLGANAWGVGLAATAFFMKNRIFQPGALVTWSYNVGTETPADESNLITVQPFLFFQLGHGTYLRSSAIATFDTKRDAYNVPLGLGVGQVLKQKRFVFNVYFEGQQTAWSYGPLLPTSQLFFGLNVQALPKR